MIQKGKKYAIIVSSLVMLVLTIAYYISTTPVFLERKITRIRSEIIDSFQNNKEDYTALAATFWDASGEESLFYSSVSSSDNMSETLNKSIDEFTQKVAIEFDNIYVGGQTINLYPKDSCVFRETIYQRNKDVYCWLDLVYSPSWERELASETLGAMLEEKIIVVIDPHWCVVVLYGF